MRIVNVLPNLNFILYLFTLVKRFDARYGSLYRSKKRHCISPAQGSFGLPRTIFVASNWNIRNMASARPEDEIGALADRCLQVTPCTYYQWHYWRVVVLPTEPLRLCRTVMLSSFCCCLCQYNTDGASERCWHKGTAVWQGIFKYWREVRLAVCYDCVFDFDATVTVLISSLTDDGSNSKFIGRWCGSSR